MVNNYLPNPFPFYRAVQSSFRLVLVLGGCQLSFLSTTLAQPTLTTTSSQLYLETGGYLASEAIPFWLRANQGGIVPRAGSTAVGQIGLYRDYRSGQGADSVAKPRRFDWGYGLQVVGLIGQRNQGLLPEAYLKARWGQFELCAGRRRDIVGLVDTLLTSGAYAQSGNALPIPKIQLATRGYVALPFTKGVLAFNALFNHGWFENEGKRVIDTRLHQAALYVRLGKPHWKVKLYGGLNHQVVWGGYSGYLPNNVSNNGSLPSGLKAYLYVIAALPASTRDIDPNTSSIDEGNRIGNHLGSLDVGAEILLSAGRLLLYRQNPYDTGALFYLTSIADGLNGISFRRKQTGQGGLSIDGLLVEWLYTESQGGPEFVLTDPNRRGRVNYFNNSQYLDGWIYYGHTIGTPFLTPQTEVRAGLPVSTPIANNRVSVWHVGLSGQCRQRIQWLAKLSYSQNLGTYDIPYPAGVNQFSALLSVTAPLSVPTLGAVQVRASLALDSGQLLANSSGAYLSLRKVFLTTPSKRTQPARQPMLRIR